ncbi:hypothetical protein [Methylomonas rapida]|uniref:Uncharacterized protein n=1 Tax=Methylomonas rapida TaxID=2963939 RepID=A0ABY7GR05_9GAMM|nr:hypothetical protein [Methylomonas rapida]WAR46925.1 hypothetical protein NM686_010550 [Methylomonas rapida]
MLKPCVINNMLNRNTHINHAPRIVYDPAERRARLAAQVAVMLQRLGFTESYDINAFVRLAMNYLQNGHSPATALDQTRKSATRVIAQLQKPQRHH